MLVLVLKGVESRYIEGNEAAVNGFLSLVLHFIMCGRDESSVRNG